METNPKYALRVVKQVESSFILGLLSLFCGETRNSVNHYLEIENTDTKKTKRIRIGITDYFGSHDPLNKEPDTWDEYYSGVRLSDLKFTDTGLEARAKLENGRYDGESVIDSSLSFDGSRVLLSRRQFPN